MLTEKEITELENRLSSFETRLVILEKSKSGKGNKGGVTPDPVPTLDERVKSGKTDIDSPISIYESLCELKDNEGPVIPAISRIVVFNKLAGIKPNELNISSFRKLTQTLRLEELLLIRKMSASAAYSMKLFANKHNLSIVGNEDSSKRLINALELPEKALTNRTATNDFIAEVATLLTKAEGKSQTEAIEIFEKAKSKLTDRSRLANLLNSNK